MKPRISSLAVAAAAAASLVANVGSPANASPESGSLAYFEGDVIDLSHSWGEATACSISDEGNYCFRTEAELDQFLAEPTMTGSDGLLATCSTELRLWDGTGQTGYVVVLDLRGIGISLSTYSFANRTSSYRIGACASVLRDSGSAAYPGSTGAGASANSMASGWDNRVTSVYIS